MMHPLFWITSLDSHFLKPNSKRLKICLQSYEIETKVSVTNNMLFMICEHKPWKLFTMLVYDKENYLTKTNNMHCSVLSMCFCSDSFMWNNLWPILAWIVHKFKKLIPTYSNVQNISTKLVFCNFYVTSLLSTLGFNVSFTLIKQRIYYFVMHVVDILSRRRLSYLMT
jgi:hypothetical protein